MRGLARILTAAWIAILGGLGFAGGAAAECDGPPPPFDETIASAKQILIGDVIAIDPANDAGEGRSRRFTLQVSDVVRGQAAAQLDMDDVPTQPCASVIIAALGDRIAVAFNGTAFTPQIEVNAVAWIAGQPPVGFEATTIENVHKLAGVPMPAPGPAAPKPDPPPPWVGPVIWGLAVGVVLVIGAVVARRAAGAR
jgi:hypothetical protein